MTEFRIDGPGNYQNRLGEAIEIVSLPCPHDCYNWAVKDTPNVRFTDIGEFFVGRQNEYDIIRKIDGFQITGPGWYKLRNGEAVEIIIGRDGAKWLAPVSGSIYSDDGIYAVGGYEDRYDIVEKLNIKPDNCFKISGPGKYRRRNGKAVDVVLKKDPERSSHRWCVESKAGDDFYPDDGYWNKIAEHLLLTAIISFPILTICSALDAAYIDNIYISQFLFFTIGYAFCLWQFKILDRRS